MSIKEETIPENFTEDGYNENANRMDINLDNIDENIADDGNDVNDHDKGDHTDYLDIDNDGNLNIRCIGTDFQV